MPRLAALFIVAATVAGCGGASSSSSSSSSSVAPSASTASSSASTSFSSTNASPTNTATTPAIPPTNSSTTATTASIAAASLTATTVDGTTATATNLCAKVPLSLVEQLFAYALPGVPASCNRYEPGRMPDATLLGEWINPHAHSLTTVLPLQVVVENVRDGLGTWTIYPNHVTMTINGKQAVYAAGFGLSIEEHGTTVLNVDFRPQPTEPKAPTPGLDKFVTQLDALLFP